MIIFLGSGLVSTLTLTVKQHSFKKDSPRLRVLLTPNFASVFSFTYLVNARNDKNLVAYLNSTLQ